VFIQDLFMILEQVEIVTQEHIAMGVHTLGILIKVVDILG